MALTANQKGIGTPHKKSPPDEVARTGRDSFLKKTGSVGHTKTHDSPEGGRTGRSGGEGQPGHAFGIGRGSADKGGDSGVKRLPDDISSV